MVCDSQRNLIAAMYFKEDLILSPMVAKIKVFACTLIFYFEIGLQNIIFEGDAKKVAEEVLNYEENSAIYGQLINWRC